MCSSDLESPKAKLIEYKEVWDTKLKIFKKDTVVTVTDFKFMQSDVVLQFSLPNAGKEMYLLHGKVGSNGSVWEGDATLPDGTWVQWSAVRRSRDKNEEKPLIVKQNPIPEVFYPNMAFGHRGELKQENAVYENVCIWTKIGRAHV